MHGDCSGEFATGVETLQKVRLMGFSMQPMPMPAFFKCHECEEDIQMTTFEYKCPNCDMIYSVTPCHAFDTTNIKAAGKNL